ncbi:gamma-glutamylcyclotransferase [Halobacteriovorax marinus]|uniref:gamma-glutamylcyclotransferase n=1 Tax=Halobacteriovorax marinus TaxID=97084 RepID=UPI003A8E325C
MNIFIFGSLLSQEVLDIVINSQAINLETIPSKIINNYKAQYVLGEDYPLLMKETGSQTIGKIIQIHDELQLLRLKYYEGEENPLLLLEGEESLYAFIADATLEPSTREWSFMDWYQSSKHNDFLKKVESFMNTYNSKIKTPW